VLDCKVEYWLRLPRLWLGAIGSN
jgi:hypothetical protein